MNQKKTISNLLLSFNKLIGKLTDEEFSAIESGDFEVELIVINKKLTKEDKFFILDFDDKVKKINESLDLAKSREQGIEVLELYLKNKKEFEFFARSIDVVVMKSDKVELIKNNIVDATVGARLRSGAIQGKDI